MIKSKHLYTAMLAVVAGFVLYAGYSNYIDDPQAAGFLSHKLNVKKVVPLPVWLKVMYVHVAFACIAMIAGAVNFSNKIVHQYRKFHKINGYVYVVSVALVDLTSGYMAPYATGGKLTSVAFNLLNIVWLGMTIAAIVRIKQKQLVKHRKWMVRSYAFCFTNMVIHLFTSLLHDGFGLAYETSYTIGVYATIAALMAAAEIVIRTVYRTPKAL